MLTFDAIGETVFCVTSGDGKAFHMNRLMNFYPQGGMKGVLSLQIENQQIQPLLETINSTDEIYLVDQKGYILAASEPEMAGLPIRTRMPEEDLEQKAQIEFERDGISKIGNIQSGVFGTKILVISDKETVLKDAKAVSRRMMFLILCSAAMVFLCIICYTRWISARVQKVVYAAKRMGQGEFDYRLENMGEDEIGQIGLAFNQLSDQIQELIRENYEKKIRIQTSELNLLQEQINPHFLFNSLNAGAQLAMMEDAEQTGIFVEKMADFFRYNVKKGQEDATLGEELEAVDNYIYILNVRFAGDIHFSKEVDESLENVRMPSMILQPVVENAVNHGIRDIEWEGKIHLTVTGDADYIRISVKDNGKGMTQEQIEGVLSGNRERRNEEGDSTGIGMNNVISRLELYYEESGLMEINSEGEGKGTEAVIYIPVHEN